MAQYRTVLTSVAVLVGLVASARDVRVQAPAPFADAQVLHVGVVVPDADQAAQVYAAFFGVPVPETRMLMNMQFPPDYDAAPNAHVKISDIRLNNTFLDIVEPRGGASPWWNFLEKNGQGLQHIAVAVTDVSDTIARLVALGGTHTYGEPGGRSGYVDMEEILGITFELLPPDVIESAATSSRPVPTKFASGEILHAGVVVRDVEKAASVFADIMGVASPQPTVDAERKSVQFPTKPVAIEFVEPSGAESPWRDHLDTFGPSIHHFALRVDDLEKDIAYLEKMGGKVVVGPDQGFALVDLRARPYGLAFALHEQ